MLSQDKTNVNTVFLLYLLMVVLAVTGTLPRTVVPYLTLALAVYLLWLPLEDSVAFFVRSIPFFIAIPITAGFDSLNMWRIFSGLIFIKWFFCKFITSSHSHILTLPVRSFMRRGENVRMKAILFGLLFLSILSVIPAQSNILALKRIIYFINLSLVGVVIYDLFTKNQDFGQRLIKNIAIPTVIVALIGIVQLATVYFMDIFQFVDFWGGVVERNMYGNAWADIAIRANTWFAYFGDQLSLRMFSIFPDTHSFPIFLLLGLPAVMALALKRVVEKEGNLKTMLKTRASMLVFFVPVIFLCLILTGTRGIWAAGGMVTILTTSLLIRRKPRRSPLTTHYSLLTYISLFLVLFFLLFGLAYYIMATDQFQMIKGDSELFGKRVKSVIDIAETSNARRIEIWKDSLRSIIKHPLLGVGIGNFPVVVGEDLARAKAGSSAHNLYLHVAAEMGLPALIFAIWFLCLLLKKLYNNFLSSTYYPLPTTYYSALLIFFPWVLIYSLTDVAIFDERAFLLFVVTTALILGQKENGHLAG